MAASVQHLLCQLLLLAGHSLLETTQLHKSMVLVYFFLLMK